MANEFYQQGPARASRVRRLFDTIAPRYDLVNDVQSLGLHRFWKSAMLRRSGLARSQTALDLCCGTGDVAFLMSRTGARVLGADFSIPMLKVAEGKAESSKDLKTMPVFLASDALRLPFAANQFDVITISYGLRNLADLPGGLREMLRVAKPGGKILVLDFGKPDFGPWRGLYFTYLRCAVPAFGWLFHRNAAAYAYILESLTHYPAQHGVQQAMLETGYQKPQIHSILGGVMTINYGDKPLGKG